MQNSILLIHIWLGPLPNYFRFWRQSCLNNPTVDFLVCTDQEVESGNNFIVHKCNLNELRKRAFDALGYEPNIPSARKLCDFKGLYGAMFAEYANDYDFWGWTDCDLIYGDIRRFITDDILSNFDYILGLGHLHMQRVNDPKYKEAFESATGIGKVGYWTPEFNAEGFVSDKGMQMKMALQSPVNQIMDEWPYGVAMRYLELYPDRVWSGFTTEGRCFEEPDERLCRFVDMFNSVNRYVDSFYAKLSGILPIWKRDTDAVSDIGAGAVYRYHEGRLTKIYFNKNNRIETTELLYAHFIHRRMGIGTTDTNSYLIIPNRFVKDKEINRITLWLYNHRIDHKRNILKKKIVGRLKRLF